MIQIVKVALNDADSTVTLGIRTDSDTIRIYREIGLSGDQAVSPVLAVSSMPTESALLPDGSTTTLYLWTDRGPSGAGVPQKALLKYSAVSTSFERSQPARAVLPSSYSLSRVSLAGDISLGDMVFNTIDSNGTVWTVTEIDGWWRLPDATVPTVPRGKNDDGSYEEDGRYETRSLVLTGSFLPTSPDNIPLARARLAQVFNSVRNPTQLIVNEDPPRYLSVRLNGKTAVTTVQPSGLSTFSVELLAADPIKYSLSESSSSVGAGARLGGWTYPRTGGRFYATPVFPNTISITNDGNYTAYPVITIIGPATDPRIELVETGDFLDFSITLDEGQFLQIDPRDKSVLYNGAVSRRGALSLDSTWPVIPPGTWHFRYTALESPNDETRAAVSLRSAWI